MPLETLCHPKYRRAARTGLLAAALALGAAVAPAAAQDEDSRPLDRKIIDGIMTGLGFQRAGQGPNINYPERSPLVIPPSRDLPPPAANSAETNPAWPDDPDIKRRKEAASKRWLPTANSASLADEESRPISRAEIDKGRVSRTARQAPRGSEAADDQRPLKPGELNNKKSVFSLKSLFGGGEQEESAKFVGEPTRSGLTQPPVGYQTPSPNQPYGLGKAKTTPTVVEDRAARDVR
jgi:hypothetical protein